jgi:hypothetical protein
MTDMARRQPAPNDAVDPVDGSRRSKLLSVTAVVVGLFGLATLIGGGLLIGVGGSWYYAIAGLAMLATAWLLWRRNPVALHLFAALVLGTVIWAVAEIGFDWWPLVPRGDIIFLIGVFLLTPWVTRRLGRRWRSAAGPLAGALVVAAIVGIVSLLASSPKEWEGQLPGPRAAMPATENAMPAGDWFAYGGDWRGTKFSHRRREARRRSAGNHVRADPDQDRRYALRLHPAQHRHRAGCGDGKAALALRSEDDDAAAPPASDLSRRVVS